MHIIVIYHTSVSGLFPIIYRFRENAAEVTSKLGGEEKVDQLHNNAKEVKKIAMKSLKRSLSEVLPVSLEEHILENILGHLNLLDEEVNEAWRFETAEEDKSGLASLYSCLTQIYCKMRDSLFTGQASHEVLPPEVLDQLQVILAEFSEKDREDNSEQVQEGDKDKEEVNNLVEI